MKLISIFCLPSELSQLERVLNILKSGLNHIDPLEFGIYITTTTSSYVVDWDNSNLLSIDVEDRFNQIEQDLNWPSFSKFQIRDDILGCVTNRRLAYEENPDATHHIWLDPDIIFDDSLLFYIDNSIKTIESFGDSNYIISPELVRLWDTTWDCLVCDKFLNKPLNYYKTHNPVENATVHGEVVLQTVVPNQRPMFKFGGGFATCIDSRVFKTIPIPDSFSHYGLEDTYIMFAADKLYPNFKVLQYKMKNLVVCEDYNLPNDYINSNIKLIDRRNQFKEQSYKAFQLELQKLNNVHCKLKLAKFN